METKIAKKTLKAALKVWGRMLLAGVLSLFLYVSMYVLGNALLARNVGYYIVEEIDGKPTVTLEHYYQDGETAGTAEVLLQDGQERQEIRELPERASLGLALVTELAMLILFGAFPYHILYKLGEKDENRVSLGRRQPDPLRGLKIGALASVPAALSYVALLLGKLRMLPGAVLIVYRLCNTPYLPLLNLVAGTTDIAWELTWWQMLWAFLPLLFIPAVGTVAYRLGYRHFSLREKIVYATPSADPGSDDSI